ncbi:hypothetical protein MTR67_007299 [Solanum verrucosum]|uniref:Integrase catalytic domain-containing protein n=1 Tax=Solanum verrucosum TaxID=315347 RepID=A0AAF0TCZ9_SOLVR|nr:hypothetical protein MTR67_007299 [Solanum verrucosum]
MVLGTRVKISTTFHPQTDGQAERTIQTLEYMLKACVIDFKGNWDDHLHLIEFAYNNSYHSSIGMALFKTKTSRNPKSPKIHGLAIRRSHGTWTKPQTVGLVHDWPPKRGQGTMNHNPTNGPPLVPRSVDHDP